MDPTATKARAIQQEAERQLPRYERRRLERERLMAARRKSPHYPKTIRVEMARVVEQQDRIKAEKQKRKRQGGGE